MPRIDIEDLSLGAGQVDRIHRIFKKIAVSLFAFPQFLLGPLLLREKLRIDDGARDLVPILSASLTSFSVYGIGFERPQEQPSYDLSL